MSENNIHASLHAYTPPSVESSDGIAWLSAGYGFAIHFETADLARQWAAVIEELAVKMEELAAVSCPYCQNPDHTRGQHAAVQQALAEANEETFG
jgi:hypothetical protein